MCHTYISCAFCISLFYRMNVVKPKILRMTLVPADTLLVNDVYRSVYGGKRLCDARIHPVIAFRRRQADEKT